MGETKSAAGIMDILQGMFIYCNMGGIEIHYVTDTFAQAELEKMKMEAAQGEDHLNFRQARYRLMPRRLMPRGRKGEKGGLIRGLFDFRAAFIWEWDRVFEAGHKAGFGAGRTEGFDAGAATGFGTDFENSKSWSLHLICHSLPGEWQAGKKERMIYTLHNRYGAVWLEDKLACALGIAQPKPEDAFEAGNQGGELLLFRTFYLTERLGWNGEALVVALEEDAGAETRDSKPGTEIDIETETKGETEIKWETETNRETALVLELILGLCDNLNYLTIVGGRAEAYEELAELLWQENGLPVRFLEKPVRGYAYGPKPLVLHLHKKRKIRPDFFGPDAKCFEVYGAVAKFLDTMARNGYNS